SDVTGKADKVSSPTNGNFAGLDSNGNLTDSGKKASDFATAAQGGKADTAIQPSQTAGLLKNDGTVDTTAYGTYSKPSGGIPSSDLASAVQTSLGKADTAYQKPGSGIPSSDMASAVQTSLGKADTAYQKPSGGIPAADLASGVIPTVPTISTNIQTDKASDVKTASPKAVYDEVHPATASSQPAGGMLPNKLYKLGTLTGNVSIAFASPSDNTIENEYKFTFTAASTAPTITWPNSITKWAGNALDNSLPNIEDGEYYEVSVVDGMGIINKFE
ncbi:MAG: hypothetical protein IK084_04375, partial [Bacteroidaceae bacterium]|nr:hypothetical protein [Bacteroidaceae bacterium]